jgi:hypothetical protein
MRTNEAEISAMQSMRRPGRPNVDELTGEVHSAPSGRRGRRVLTSEQEQERQRVLAERAEVRRQELAAVRALDPACETDDDPPIVWRAPVRMGGEPNGVLLELPRVSGRGKPGSRLLLAERSYDGAGPNGGEAHDYVTAFVVFRDGAGYQRRTVGAAIHRAEGRAFVAAVTRVVGAGGSPESGAVFPARTGKRAGGFRAPVGHSYARRLRDALSRAGVWRMPPIQVPATKPRMRTDLGRRAEGTKPAPEPRRPPLLRDRDNAPGRLPLVPSRLRVGARRGRRQRPASHAPLRAHEPSRSPALRDAHHGHARDPRRRPTAPPGGSAPNGPAEGRNRHGP